jgi:WD40 repeat-containing protein SMU1
MINILSLVILESVYSVPKSRLTHLIASALKWEEHCGNISANSSFDLLHGTVPSGVEIFHPNTEGLDKFPKNCFNSVKLPSGSFAECLGFSPNGAYFVVGTVDGFMEVWNPLEGTLRTDLPYQQNESDIISTKGSAISAIAFSLDSELLACGTISGEVLVWKLSTGKQVKAFQKVHQNGITSISFSSDQHSLLTTGFDNNLHILGLKSGRILKEFRGHTSYVNSALWIDESLILSGGHDGSLKVWDVQRVECVFSLIPTGEQALSPPPIRSICKYFTPETKGADDSFYLITTQSSKLHLFSLLKRAFIQTIPVSIKAQSHIVFSALRKSFIFSLSNDGQFMAIRSNSTSSIFGNMRVSELEPIGFALHPNFDVLVTFDIGGEIKFWKS